MNIENFHSAKLDEETLFNLQQLEEKLGLMLIAIEPDPQPAKLNEQELQLIRELEAKTGHLLVAYEH